MDIKIENINDMRLFASYYVEVCNNNNKDKLQFMNFINEANENQIVYLLTNGVMVSSESKYLNEDVFNLTFMAKVHLLYKWGGGGAMGAANVGHALATAYWPHAIVVAAAAYAATKVYKEYLSKAAKACSSKKGDTKKTCMQKYKLDGMKQSVANLNKAKSQCKKTKNPTKCVKGIDSKIAKLKKKIQSNTA